ncbi:elongation factor 1-delta-like isoform X2 [Antedon mediterranea]|uniref:elongation factor 1-delta-like isoform X2 n=1 Tax=Antedon mediterranea TaxID=105859 RepID=UPI003AF90DC3
MAPPPMILESVWLDKCRVEDAEVKYHEKLASQHAGLVVEGVGLKVGVAVPDSGVSSQRFEEIEKENKLLKKVTEDLRADVSKLFARVAALEKAAGTPQVNGVNEEAVEADDDDDDEDLFGDTDDEDAEELAKIKAERIAAYDAKKAKKPTLIAKSNIILDVKPWDDETDMKELEKKVREIKTDGLLWGTGKLVPVAYGIKKLQISCVVEDDKVGTDFLEEKITNIEDFVQSMDVVAFNKI